MKLKLNIHTSMSTNKTLSIPLILIFSICLFVTNAFAGGCYGDESCFKCGQMDHRHATGPETDFMPYGCQPGTPNSACGIRTNRIFDSQAFLISAIRVDNHEDSSIPAGPALDYSRDLFSKGHNSPAHSSVVTIASPIYLLNLSLLC
jgi:hypothetical protein